MANQAQSNAEGHADLGDAAVAAAGAAALAGAISGVEAEIAALQAQTSALEALDGESILSAALATLIEDGLLFGFLAAAVKDPKGTADVSTTVLDLIVSMVGGLLDSLIGWAA